MNNTFFELLTNEVEKTNKKNARSAWGRGVATYTAELLDTIRESIEYNGTTPATVTELKSVMLNGADSWTEYSWGGCSLIYDCDIAAALCTPSELKKTRNGERRPNSREEWLDTQARALTQAAGRIVSAFTVVSVNI